MKPIFYHYLHCPFCLRVRMGLGLLQISYESRVLDYDDEITPLQLCGKKMLPIMVFSEGAINESLDILLKLDQTQRLQINQFMNSSEFSSFNKTLDLIGGVVHNLAMPWWVWSKEFTPAARAYFEQKKSVKRGPFSELIKQQDTYLAQAQAVMIEVEKLIHDVDEQNISIKDIMLASHLWGLYIVPEWQFSPPIHSYLQQIKKLTHFNYLGELWP